MSAAQFAAIRYSVLNISDRHSIIIDGRIGKWLTSGDGIYVSVAPGFRWKIKNKLGLTVSVVYNISRLHGTFGRVAEHVLPKPGKSATTINGLGLGASIDF